MRRRAEHGQVTLHSTVVIITLKTASYLWLCKSHRLYYSFNYSAFALSNGTRNTHQNSKETTQFSSIKTEVSKRKSAWISYVQTAVTFDLKNSGDPYIHLIVRTSISSPLIFQGELTEWRSVYSPSELQSSSEFTFYLNFLSFLPKSFRI